MSLCYDFQKWTIISMLAILTVCLVGMINLAHGQEQGQYTGQTTIPVPKCVETVSPTKVILHIDVLVSECSGSQGLGALAKNTLYFLKLGYETVKDEKISTFLDKEIRNQGDSVLVLEKQK